MSEMVNDIQLVDNKELRQFEVTIDGMVAKIEYNKMDDRVFLTHTEVPDQLHANGVGSLLAEKTLKEIENSKYKVVPACAFVKNYIRKNPEYRRLLAPGIIIE
jgi:predicted GNAT family acetyltransferase